MNFHLIIGLRTLTIAYQELNPYTAEFETRPENNLILIGIVGIEDPLRPEVPEAINQCKLAGITVRMVTGDSIFKLNSYNKR